MGNFETRLVGFLIYAYINNSSVADNSSINAQSNKLNSNGSIVDFELNIIMENSITKITAFNELCLKNSSNLENLINDFIKGYAIRLKKTEVRNILLSISLFTIIINFELFLLEFCR